MDLPADLIRMEVQRGSILLSDSFEDIDHAKYSPDYHVKAGFARYAVFIAQKGLFFFALRFIFRC